MSQPAHLPFGVFVVLLMMSGAAAKSGQWLSAKVSGQVLRNGTNLHSGQGLEIGDKIRTGRAGRVLIVKDKDRVIVTPNSRFQVPRERSPNYRTELFQFLGTMKYDVEFAPWRRFAVRTPYLAIVVKGTAFKVDIGSNKTTVSVTRGAVQVTDGDTGQRALLKAGQMVTTLHRPNAGLVTSTMRSDLQGQDGAGNLLSAEQGLTASVEAGVDIGVGGSSGTASAGAGASAGGIGGSAGASVGAGGVGASVGLDF